ncbi:peptidylprolyl isomerase [Propionibacterium acidifaciens]|nr:peptidylprolyl isomerase [Propionibacterium acidifaciens]
MFRAPCRSAVTRRPGGRGCERTSPAGDDPPGPRFPRRP